MREPLANAVCDKCKKATFKYGLFFWHFYLKKWEILETRTMCPRCDKVFPLPHKEVDVL